MQSSSILCCSSKSISPTSFQRFTLLSTKHRVNVSAAVFSSSSKLPLASSRPRQSSRSTINSSAAPELVETSPELIETNSSASGFVETGYTSGVHGLQGEVRVKPSTDFPDLRFSKEWKERKKFQRQLIAAKKKLCEMEQQHVFYGFRYGEKDKTSLLANQIVTVNSKLLQQALQYIQTPFARKNVPQILSVVPKTSTLKIAANPISAQGGKLSDLYWKLQREGDLLSSCGKVAISLVLEEVEVIEGGPNNGHVNSKGTEKACLLVKELLDDPQRLVEVKNRPSVPLIFVCPAHSVSSLQELFALHDHFAFDPHKVWFLEEETLPVVSSSLDEHGKHKILMKSPWEFLQRPVGSGGFISLLSSHDLLDRLSEIGVEYIEVCTTTGKHIHGGAFLGLVDSCKSNIGIHLHDATMSEEHFDMLFSISFMKQWVNHINKVQFHTVLTSHSYVEKVDKDWIDITPSTPNSYEFHCSIYSCLDACSPKKICVLDSAE